MLVCVCNGVSDKDIDSAITDGLSSCKKIRSELNIGKCCGQCTHFAKDMISEKISSFQAASNLAYEVRV